MTACFIHSSLEHGNFLNSDISQGSVVTQLTCGEIISQGFVANLRETSKIWLQVRPTAVRNWTETTTLVQLK